MRFTAIPESLSVCLQIASQSGFWYSTAVCVCVLRVCEKQQIAGRGRRALAGFKAPPSVSESDTRDTYAHRLQSRLPAHRLRPVVSGFLQGIRAAQIHSTRAPESALT